MITVLLLDTHVLVWLQSGERAVSANALSAFEKAERLVVSVVSAWEWGIKRQRYGAGYGPPFEEITGGIGVERADLPFECHIFAEQLPPIHHDPFDRMLIAHARQLGCALVTSDTTLHRYPVDTVW